MNRILPAVAAALVLQAAPARAELVLWQGQARVDAASAGCGAGGDARRAVVVGDVIRAVFRPKLVGTNGNDTRISFIPNASATWLAIMANGATPSGVMTAFGSDYSGMIRANEGGNYRSFRQLPTTPTATTPVIDVKATFENFLFLPGCTATVRGAFVLRTN